MHLGGAMKKSRGVWFWILIVSIFVLYCISWQRPFCQTLDANLVSQLADQASVVASR
jgi:hypothetical protein